MARDIYFKIDQKEIDANGTETLEVTSIIDVSFTEKVTGEFSLASAATYTNIPIGNLTTVNVLKLSTTEDATFKLNAGSEIFSCTDVILLVGAFTQIDVSSNTGTASTIKYEFYGV